jgi:hypothetical protein
VSKLKVARRAVLGLFAAVVLFPAIDLSVAKARPHVPLGAVSVDVAPLRRNAGDPTATWVARALPSALAWALASVGRGGAPIAVRIHYVILGSSSSGSLPGGAVPDQMVGEVAVGGISRELRAQTRYYPMAVDQPNFEQSNFWRIVQLSWAFAYWAARGA